MTETQKYPILMRIIHWTMAIVILGMIGSGFYMEDLEKGADKWWWYDLHKSFGVVAIILITIRIVVRLAMAIPAIPAGIKAIEAKLAHIVHVLLYIFMIAVPISGYIMSDAGGHAVKLFGIVMPDVFADKQYPMLGDVSHFFHGYAPYVMLGIVVLHVAGAIKHQFEEPENRVLKRML